jgi:hypothetical protein
MSYSNYKTYNQLKGFQEKLRGVYVCRNGDSMTGNLNMTCNDILNVTNVSFCDGGKIIGDIELSGNLIVDNLDISGTLNLNCNNIIDVSSITFCEGGTYIGPGESFDISTNEVLHLKTGQYVLVDGDTIFNHNVDISGNLIVRGTTTTVSTQQLQVKDNLIVINQTMDVSGNVDPSGLLPDPNDFESGFVVYRGPDGLGNPVREPYQFLYDENSNTFQIGISGEMQPVATREDNPTNNGLAVWDATDNRFVTDRGVLIDGSGNLDLNCNLINDVSGINFCDGTYIGHGSSFDISTNEELHIKSSQDIIMDSSQVIIDGRQSISTNATLSLHSGDGKDCLINMIEDNVTRWTLRNQGNNGDRFFIQGEGGANDKWFTLEQTSGNCGIGSVNPTHKLDVNGNTIIRGELDMSDNLINDVSGINFSDGTYIGHGSSFDISTNEVLKINQDKIVVDTNGNVGIGTVTPANKLDINGGMNISGRINMRDQGTGNYYSTLYNTAGFTILRSAPTTDTINIRSQDLSKLYASFGPSGTIIDSNLDVSEIMTTKFANINYQSPTLENNIIIKGGPLQMDLDNVPTQTRINSGIYIGSTVGDSGDEYSLLIGSNSSGGSNSYFNTSVGMFNDISGSLNGTTIMGYNCRSTGGESVGIGRRVRVTPSSTIVGSQGNTGNALTTGTRNTFIGNLAGNTISQGSNNIAIGYNARFNNDVSNCLLINNQNNSAIGGVYGTNLGSLNFNLGINTNTPSSTLDVSGNSTIRGNLALAGDLTFENNGINVMTFSDFSSNTQNTQLPSINNQPVSLTRVSIFKNDISYNVPANGELILPFGNVIKNQLNLSISGLSGEIITPSLDISGQDVEIYANVEIKTGANDTGFSLDISGVDCNFKEIIDSVVINKKNEIFYITLGPHMFLPEEWAGCSQFKFKIVDNVGRNFDVLRTKIIFKSYYL